MNRTRGGVVQQRTAAAQRRYAPSEADESVASEVGSAAPVNELFQAIKLGQSLQVAVDNWIAGYKDDANEALCELLNLLMIVSGCRGQITVEHLAVESTTVIQQLTEQFDEDSGEYPFMSNGQHARRLRANFADFLLIFMRQIQHSIVFDEFLVENFLNFVIALTDSQVRAFRHTATFAAMKILTGLVESALQLRTNLEHAKKQYDAERARVEATRRGGAAANERVASLREKCDELEKQSKVLGDFQATLFKGVFVHRYRDTLTDIRVLCMHEIGTWIRRAPFTYLDDAYLKYVGWTLYDKVAEVRLECLRTLISLYENAAFVSRLELFTNRFRERLVEMTSDREPEAALHAVKLLRLIHQRTPDLLPDKDCEAVFELIFSANRALAQAAGEFLNQKLFARVRPAAANDEESAALATNYAERHYSADDYRRVLRQIVAFFNETEMHEHAAYLVDALLERNPALRQWRVIIGMLLSDADADQTDTDLGVDGGLSSKEETVLIDVLVCSVRQACTGDAPIGRGTQSAGTTVQKRAQKEQKALLEERRRMTEQFIVALPNLLARFLTDSEKLANLLLIPTYMQLDLYVTNRQERYLDQLLKLLCEIVEKHQDDEVLLRTARIFELLANRYRSNSPDADSDDVDTVPFASESHAHKVNVVLGNLLDKLTQRFATASQTYAAAIEDADEHDDNESSLVNDSANADELQSSSVAYQTLSALRKLVAFYHLHDLSSRGLWDGFGMIVERNLQKPSLGSTSFEIVKRSLSGMAHALQWGALCFETIATRASGEQLLRERDADGDARRNSVKFGANEQTELRRLGERVRAYFGLVQTLLDRHASGPGRVEQLEETLALTSDLLVLFSRNLLDLNAPDLSVHLVFSPPDEFLSVFVRRVEQFVFVPRDGVGKKPGAPGDDDIDAVKLDALHKRRNILAALAKLVIFNLVPQRAAVGMFARFAAYYNDFGDLIRQTLVKSRELSRELHAEALAEALQFAFRRSPTAHTANSAATPLFIDRSSTQFAALKELAKKLALSFGADLHRNKETVRRIHEHSIRFMFDTYRAEKTAFDAHAQAQSESGQLAPRGRPHPHHVFLLAEPLLEFAGRLVGPDKKTVSLALEQQIVAQGIDLRNRSDAFWQALNSYRSSLAVDGSLLQQSVQQSAARATVQLAANASVADASALSAAQFKVPGATVQQVQSSKRRLDADAVLPSPTVAAAAQNVVVTVKRPRHDADGNPVATSQIIVANQSSVATPSGPSTRSQQRQ